MNRTRLDVAVVGYGPTGMVLSALLAQAGHDVVVLEQFAGLYNLPRAATFDDETMRVFQKLGMADTVQKGTRFLTTYDWCNAEGQTLIRHTFSDRGISGWPEFNMMYQPWLEDQLDLVCRSSGVEVLHGHRVTAVAQDEDAATVTVVDPVGRETEIVADFVVACDGGNSTVRSELEIGSLDLGFSEPWLVCDFRLKRHVEGLPTALQLGDPREPVSIFSIDDVHQRFAFMLHAGERPGDDSEENVWRRVARWLTPEDADLIRLGRYTFRSLVADRWVDGRILLAGDAAHQMPPFLGQGMCSGIRDADNLAWKIDLILSGGADPALLSTFQQERQPHVRRVMDKAIALGRIQTIRDPELARARDEKLLRERAGGQEPAGFVFPAFEDGLLGSRPDDAARGALCPQTRLRTSEGSTMTDDLLGPGFSVITLDPDAAAAAAESSMPTLLLDPASTSAPPAVAASRPRHVLDDDGMYATWLAEHDCTTVLLRPDRYVFGSASTVDGLRQMLSEVSDRLGAPLHPAVQRN